MDTGGDPDVDSPPGGLGSHVNSQRIRVAECVRAIRHRMSVLSGADYKRRNTSEDGSNCCVPVDVSLEVIVCHPVSFHSLLRRWIRCVVSPPSEGGQRLRFDLPETLDGTQCSISLDLSPTVLPYRLDSYAAAGLAADVRWLTFRPVEVVRIIPVPSVDASLIFGIPMSVRAAVESDLVQYKEMRLLVRQLWRYLGSSDLALLLRCCTAPQLSGGGGRCMGGYFDYHAEGQYCILMTEETLENEEGSSLSNLIPKKGRRGHAPGNGILYRYAMSDQLLRDCDEGGEEEADGSDPDIAETGRQYFEYIEQSLECLDRSSGINPALVMDNPDTPLRDDAGGVDTMSDEGDSGECHNVVEDRGPLCQSNSSDSVRQWSIKETDSNTTLAHKDMSDDYDDDPFGVGQFDYAYS